MKRIKPILLIQIGPIHLFWTTGVYLLWELKKKYQFIILADGDYQNSIKFQKIIEYLDITYIYYQRNEKGYKLVKNLYKDFKFILKKFSPKKILLYNSEFLQNQVLINTLDKKIKYEIYEYQNGRETSDIVHDRQMKVANAAETLVKRYRFLKTFNKARIILVKLRDIFKYIFYFKLLPVLITGKMFKPYFNIYTAKINSNRANKFYSEIIKKYFVYLEIEMQFALKSANRDFQIVNHPASTCGYEVNQILYGKILEKNQLLIAPSMGFVEKEILKGKSMNELVNFISNKYICVLDILLKIYPNFKIKYKLHPDNPFNSVWLNIFNSVANKYKDIEQVKPSTNIEKIILESKIIISDVSSVLWWNIFLDNKISISLDIFNFDYGNEMSHYSDYIYYIDDLNKLEKINLLPKNKKKEEKNISQIL